MMCCFCVFRGRVMIALVWALFYPAVKQWQRKVELQSQRELNVVWLYSSLVLSVRFFSLLCLWIQICSFFLSLFVFFITVECAVPVCVCVCVCEWCVCVCVCVCVVCVCVVCVCVCGCVCCVLCVCVCVCWLW